MAETLLEPNVLLVCGCDNADCIRKTIEACNVLPITPMRKSRQPRVAVGPTLNGLRNLMERYFNKLKNACRVATRHDKAAERVASASPT